MLKRISLSDKKEFIVFTNLQQPLSDLSFTVMFIWNPVNEVRWKKINDNLCVFSEDDDTLTLWGPPIGGTKIQETVDECFQIMDDYNDKNSLTKKPSIGYIPQELFETFNGLSGHRLKEQSRDYIYLSKDLIRLEGKQYKNKRNAINNLLKHHDVRIEKFSKKHVADCLEVLNQWLARKKKKVSGDFLTKLEQEAAATANALHLSPQLNLQGMVVFVDEKLEAFTFGEALTKKMCSIIIEKTNLSITGLPQYVFREFVSRFWSSYKYVNAGEDWGVAYLRKTKELYRPHRTIKSYSLVRK